MIFIIDARVLDIVVSFWRIFFYCRFFRRSFLATVPADTNLSLGKLGRATNVDNSDYTSETSLNSSARDSGTGAVSMSQFYIGSVDDSLSGYS